MRRVVLAFLVALALASAGCDSVAGSAAGSEPTGGWPQPAGQRITSDMCGLLTKADYTRLGHVRQPSMWGTVAGKDNSLDCQYRSNDELTLSLQPTAEFAKYVFATGLQEHKDGLTQADRPSALVSDVVGPADESWFDRTLGSTDATPEPHELRLRRGALIVGIVLGGVRGKKEKDPRGVLTDLADLVLRRLPHVGAKDTATTHEIEYAVAGSGTAATLDWEDYTGLQHAGFLSHARLPWLRTIPMAFPAGTSPDRLSLTVRASSSNKKVSCLIVVDDVPVASDGPGKGFADCESTFPDLPDSSGGGGDDPDPAQPASTGPRKPSRGGDWAGL
jgi:hypothetical protein